MSVNIESPALSISESLDLLKTTPPVMHRIVFNLTTTGQWYKIMQEARRAYGKNWKSQSHVKRKLDTYVFTKRSIPVWFEVPDPTFATWCAVKLAVEVISTTAK